MRSRSRNCPINGSLLSRFINQTQNFIIISLNYNILYSYKKLTLYLRNQLIFILDYKLYKKREISLSRYSIIKKQLYYRNLLNLVKYTQIYIYYIKFIQLNIKLSKCKALLFLRSLSKLQLIQLILTLIKVLRNTIIVSIIIYSTQSLRRIEKLNKSLIYKRLILLVYII